MAARYSVIVSIRLCLLWALRRHIASNWRRSYYSRVWPIHIIIMHLHSGTLFTRAPELPFKKTFPYRLPKKPVATKDKSANTAEIYSTRAGQNANPILCQVIGIVLPFYCVSFVYLIFFKEKLHCSRISDASPCIESSIWSQKDAEFEQAILGW